MTDFYAETVKRLTSMESRLHKLETAVPNPNLWLKRARLQAVVGGVMDGRALGYVQMNPAPATQDLNTISNGFNGQVMILRVEGAADAVTLKDGVGNISLPVSGDILLDDPEKAVMLLYDESLNAGAGLWIGFCCPSSVAAFLDLSDTPASYAGAALQLVRVNAGQTALEFVAAVDTNTPGELGALVGKTLAADAFTVNVGSWFYELTAEAAGVDDCATINGGADGKLIVLSAASGQTITITEAGNIQVVGATRTLDATADKWFGIYHNGISKWCEISQAGNA